MKRHTNPEKHKASKKVFSMPQVQEQIMEVFADLRSMLKNGAIIKATDPQGTVMEFVQDTHPETGQPMVRFHGGLDIIFPVGDHTDNVTKGQFSRPGGNEDGDGGGDSEDLPDEAEEKE